MRERIARTRHAGCVLIVVAMLWCVGCTPVPALPNGSAHSAPSPSSRMTTLRTGSTDRTSPSISGSPAGATATVPVAPSSIPPAARDGEDGDGEPLLLWVAGLATAGLITGLLLWRRRRVRGSTWEVRLEAARAEAQWMADDLLSQILACPVAERAAVLWQAGRPRLRLVEEELGTLSVEGEPADLRSAAAALQAALIAAAAAVDAECALHTDEVGERFRAARAHVEATRSRLRAALAAAGGP